MSGIPALNPNAFSDILRRADFTASDMGQTG
jgi:hypothetical protein